MEKINDGDISSKKTASAGPQDKENVCMDKVNDHDDKQKIPSGMSDNRQVSLITEGQANPKISGHNNFNTAADIFDFI